MASLLQQTIIQICYTFSSLLPYLKKTKNFDTLKYQNIMYAKKKQRGKDRISWKSDFDTIKQVISYNTLPLLCPSVEDNKLPHKYHNTNVVAGQKYTSYNASIYHIYS